MELSPWAIVDAFPSECEVILPKELRRVKGILQEYLDCIENVREDYIDDFERYFWVEVVKIFMPCDEKRLYYQLLEIKKMAKIRKNIKDVVGLDLAGAKNRPIEGLYNFQNKKCAGRNIVTLCPFHNEKTGSFYIYTQRNRFHCFGCGMNGDAIDFIMKLNGLCFVDAVKYLLKMTNERNKILKEKLAEKDMHLCSCNGKHVCKNCQDAENAYYEDDE